jgi:hypothetical protein
LPTDPGRRRVAGGRPRTKSFFLYLNPRSVALGFEMP